VCSSLLESDSARRLLVGAKTTSAICCTTSGGVSSCLLAVLFAPPALAALLASIWTSRSRTHHASTYPRQPFSLCPLPVPESLKWRSVTFHISHPGGKREMRTSPRFHSNVSIAGRFPALWAVALTNNRQVSIVPQVSLFLSST